MKFFVCFALIAFVASTLATPTGTNSGASSSNAGVSAGQESEAEGQGYGDLTRLRKSAYGGSSSSVPAPPCPKNYLFSCQPNLAPVPCAAAAPAYGSAGAYSSPSASYIDPNYALPQLRQLLNHYYPQAFEY